MSLRFTLINEAHGVFASASTPRNITTSHLSTQRKKKKRSGEEVQEGESATTSDFVGDGWC